MRCAGMTASRQRGLARFTRANGDVVSCEVLDLSMSGVSLETVSRPPLGEVVLIGQMAGRVARHHDNGIAIEFMTPMPAAAADNGPPECRLRGGVVDRSSERDRTRRLRAGSAMPSSARFFFDRPGRHQRMGAREIFAQFLRLQRLQALHRHPMGAGEIGAGPDAVDLR